MNDKWWNVKHGWVIYQTSLSNHDGDSSWLDKKVVSFQPNVCWIVRDVSKEIVWVEYDDTWFHERTRHWVLFFLAAFCSLKNESSSLTVSLSRNELKPSNPLEVSAVRRRGKFTAFAKWNHISQILKKCNSDLQVFPSVGNANDVWTRITFVFVCFHLFCCQELLSNFSL